MIEAPRVQAYEPQFDRALYQSPEKEDRKRLDTYTKKQIETHLGERFNVLLSTTRYELKNGQIFSKDLDEPFFNSLKRGRDYRRNYGNPIDFEREDAEVLGFSKIEEKFGSGEGRVGDIVLSVSPAGGEDSIYKHNFYDIFTLKEDEKGQYLETRRYSSGLSIEETTDKLKALGVLDSNLNPKAEDFLSNPIEISSSIISSDDLHKFLHKEHDYTDNEEFEEAKRITASLIVSYIKSLSENPFNTYEHNLRLNATLNGMDVAMDLVRRNKGNFRSDFYDIFKNRTYVDMLSKTPVREVSTGCGISGGFQTKAMELMRSPFSVADKDPKKGVEKQTLCCTCPFCSTQVEAEIGGGRITCPNCKKSASWKN